MIPADLKYTEDHVWVRIEGNKVLIGITEYAQGELGDVVFVDLPAVGEKIKQKAQLANIESVKAVTEINAPVSGEILEVHDDLHHNPEWVNQDPFHKGWIAVIELEKPHELKDLMTAEEYKKLTGTQG